MLPTEPRLNHLRRGFREIARNLHTGWPSRTHVNSLPSTHFRRWRRAYGRAAG